MTTHITPTGTQGGTELVSDGRNGRGRLEERITPGGPLILPPQVAGEGERVKERKRDCEI